jgi:hypothetical protein
LSDWTATVLSSFAFAYSISLPFPSCDRLVVWSTIVLFAQARASPTSACLNLNNHKALCSMTAAEKARLSVPQSFFASTKCATSEVPQRSAPSSGSTSQDAFSRRKMWFLTLGGSHVKEAAWIEPIVTLMLSSSNVYSIVRGVPQLAQKVRSATSDSFNVLSVDDLAYTSALFGTETKGRYAEPDKCWHALQWQSVMSDGGLFDLYSTDPQRQPPLKTSSSAFVSGTNRDPSVAIDRQFPCEWT